MSFIQIIVIVVVSGAIAGIILGFADEYRKGKKEWNNGTCLKCGQIFKATTHPEIFRCGCHDYYFMFIKWYKKLDKIKK